MAILHFPVFCTRLSWCLNGTESDESRAGPPQGCCVLSRNSLSSVGSAIQSGLPDSGLKTPPPPPAPARWLPAGTCAPCSPSAPHWVRCAGSHNAGISLSAQSSPSIPLSAPTSAKIL